MKKSLYLRVAVAVGAMAAMVGSFNCTSSENGTGGGGSGGETAAGGQGGEANTGGESNTGGQTNTGGSAPGCTEGSSQSCYTGPPGTKDVGLCQAGTQSCQEGQWGPCDGEVKPASEVCDGADNDCDGQVDNGGDALCAGDGQGHACVKGTPSSFCGCFDDNDCPQGQMCCGCGESGYLTICGDIQDGKCVCP